MLIRLKRCLTRLVERQWYRSDLTLMTACLLPFSWVFAVVVKLRRLSYQKGYFSSSRINLPVIVVGNITVGGTGKTPCVIALAEYLVSRGFHPGIITRGYGGKHHEAKIVLASDDACNVGDEAVLLARRAHCPVIVGANRVQAAKLLMQEYPDCDIVISDDGLQHYALQRDIEIAIIDGIRHLGNGYLLPAGPLREPQSRLKSVDFVVVNGAASASAYSMKMIAHDCTRIIGQSHLENGDSLKPCKVHAVAALGNPDRFFNYLRMSGFDITEHAFPDHYQFTASDFQFSDTNPIVMTEKDAVKCMNIADQRMWYLPISAALDQSCLDELSNKIKERKDVSFN